MTTTKSLGDLALESGEVLKDVRLAYDSWGSYDGTNAVLVLHALTGDSVIAGGTGWWSKVVGPGMAIDTDKYFVVAANVLGGCAGSTGPEHISPFPALTIRDQVTAEKMLMDALGIERWYGVTGGSAGGMRALEWAIMYPPLVERLFVLACGAAASAEQIAFCRIQNDIIDVAGPVAGLDLARRIAHVTYRSAAELDFRFGREVQEDGRWAVESYLQHHGAKLVKRFNAESYQVLSDAMNSHDIGRGRGGAEAALASITATTVVAGVDSDWLYPLAEQQALADAIPGCSGLDVIESHYGHDGFLIEAEQVGVLARQFLV